MTHYKDLESKAITEKQHYSHQKACGLFFRVLHYVTVVYS